MSYIDSMVRMKQKRDLILNSGYKKGTPQWSQMWASYFKKYSSEVACENRAFSYYATKYPAVARAIEWFYKCGVFLSNSKSEEARKRSRERWEAAAAQLFKLTQVDVKPLWGFSLRSGGIAAYIYAKQYPVDIGTFF